jgi:hypothetical protein
LPESEELKAFYALGVNVAKQVGGEVKGLLNKEEIVAMTAGFSDSMQDKVEDDRALLMKYGKGGRPSLVQIVAVYLISPAMVGSSQRSAHVVVNVVTVCNRPGAQ